MTNDPLRMPTISLNSIIDRYDRDGNPLPEHEIETQIAKQKADAVRKKKNGYARDSHWSVRRMFHSGEIIGFRAMLAVLLGMEEATKIENGMQGNGRIAASETLRRARARRALNIAATVGRPKTPEQRLVAEVVSIEAFMGAGLNQKAAFARAADKWGHKYDRMFDIYKDNRLPQYGGSDLLRAFFHKTKLEEVDRFIEQFLASGGSGE